MARKAERESFSQVPETCPYVDRALYSLLDQMQDYFTIVDEGHALKLFAECEVLIKEQTCALRDALTRAISENMELEEEIELLQCKVVDMKYQVEDLKQEVSALEKAGA